MKRWKAILGVLLVFLIGMLSGALLAQRYHQGRMERFLSGRPGAAADIIVRRLSRSLDLDGAQQEQVRAIVTDTHRRMEDIRRPVQPRLDEALERGRARIREILRPDQQARFDRMTAEWKTRRGMGRRHGGPP